MFEVDNTHQLEVDAGVVARFPHKITNKGNTDETYSFLFDDLDRESFDQPQVFWDLNGNGILDPNEPEIDSTPVLQTQESINIIIIARLSPTLQDDQVKNFLFSIKSETSGHIEEINNRVKTGKTAATDITLKTIPECNIELFPEDVVTHTVNVKRTGFRPIENTEYILDGNVFTGSIFELAVPENTVYRNFTESSEESIPGSQVLKIANSSNNEWISASSYTDELSQITHVGYLVDSNELLVRDAAVFSVQFEVQGTNLSNRDTSTTAFHDADLDRTADYSSNATCSTFSSLEAAVHGQLRFIEPNSAIREAGDIPDLYKDSDFVDVEKFSVKRNESDSYSSFRDGLYLELSINNDDHIGHNEIRTDIAGNRYVIVSLTSELTKDSLQVVLLETNTPGVYRSVAPIVLSTYESSDGGVCPTIQSDAAIAPMYDRQNSGCALKTRGNDRLSSLFGDGEIGFEVEAVATIIKQSIIFDSHTLDPVEGVKVQILRVDNNQLMADSVNGDYFEYVTGNDGRFTLPKLIDDIDYYLNVIPPLGYSFPSKVLPFRLPEYKVHGFAYGKKGLALNDDKSGVFSGAILNTQGSFDIPIDLSEVGSLLAVDKIAVQQYVDIGQSASYIVTVKNSSDKDIEQVVVTDTLPFGFRYVKGTTLQAKVPVADPERNDEGALLFEIGSLPANESIVLSYSLRASAAALDGNGVNTAFAEGLTSTSQITRSQPGRAKVVLQRGGVLSNKASIFGKIFVDQDCNKKQNNKEWPIGGVRLYLHDGTYAVTDNDGQYSLYGLEPGRYVIRVDEHTLPRGLDLKLLSVNQAADASSRFVDLSEGDFHKADFATNCPKENAGSILRELKQRNSSLENGWILNQGEKYNALNHELGGNTEQRPDSSDGDISNGLIDGPLASDINSHSTLDKLNTARNIQGDKAVNARKSSDTQINESIKTESAVVDIQTNKIDVKKIAASVTNEQAKEGTWLWPVNDLSSNGRFMAVIRAGIEPTLYVNENAIPPDHLGERIVNIREKAQVVAWYGIELKPGVNTVEVKGTDPFGNSRVLASGEFRRPSFGSQIKLSTNTDTVAADGGLSVLPVKIQILDNNGYPALGVYYITLESSDGSWIDPDIQDTEPGRQIRVEDGVRTVRFKPSGKTGEVKIVARTGEFSDELTIHQVTEVRPLIVSGFVEAGAQISTEGFGNFTPSSELDDLKTKERFDSRAALFIKGTIKNNYNLTFSYDSDKDDKQQLLRDINPVLEYPIHGDSSIKGFEGQSRSKLYVKLEKNKNSFMWGDFITDANSDSNDLARSNRALTGINSVVNIGKNTLRVFVAEENNQNISEEIPGNGSSLLYRLKNYPIVPNSEIVELITRSKSNPGLIIDTVRLNRLGDYTVDDDLGYLAFSTSIPTLDGEQNPVYIRVSYDVTGDGEDYLVSGLRFDRKVSDNMSFGTSITYDGHETEGVKLLGVYGDYQLGNRTRLSASTASSDSIERGTGRAHSISINHQWNNPTSATTSITKVHADADFHNIGASTPAGRTETRIQHRQNLNSESNGRLLLDANRSKSAFTTDERRSYSAMIENDYKNWQIRAGWRQTSQKRDSGKDDSITAELGLRRKIDIFGKNGEASVELEQDIELADRQRITAGGSVNLDSDIKAYANYELINSLLGLSGIAGNSKSESFVLGVASEKLKSTKLYSEYRLRGAFDSRGHETASGIRGDYEIAKGLRVNPQFEYIRQFGSESDSVSASIGISDTRNTNSRKRLRVETRHTQKSDHYGFRASLTSRINNDWTAMLSDNLSRQEAIGADTVHRHTFTAAIARRPKYTNRHHMLFMYRLRQTKGVTSGLSRSTDVLSTHQNFQINQSTKVSARLGIKKDKSKFEGNDVSDLSTLVDTRVSYDISYRTSIEANLGTLSTDWWSETRYALGLGLNYTLNKNARLSVGYNLLGFRDKDFDDERYNAKGARIGLQYKLDEELFNWLK